MARIKIYIGATQSKAEPGAGFSLPVQWPCFPPGYFAASQSARDVKTDHEQLL